MATICSAHVSRVLALVEARPFDALPLRAVARTIGLSEDHLATVFRIEMGISLHEYLARRRMDRASSMILQGVKVEAVALEVGYRSKKNFYRQFRRRFGMTPGAYRRLVWQYGPTGRV